MSELLEQWLFVKGNQKISIESICIVVKKSVSEQITSHILDDLARVLVCSMQVLFIPCEATGFNKAAEEK